MRSSPLGPWVWMTRQCGHAKPQALPLVPMGQHSNVGIASSLFIAQASGNFLRARHGTGEVRVLLARTTRLAPKEASHEPQIGLGLLQAELPQHLPAVSSPDVKQIVCKGFPETVTRRPSRATSVPSDKTATYVALL